MRRQSGSASGTTYFAGLAAACVRAAVCVGATLVGTKDTDEEDGAEMVEEEAGDFTDFCPSMAV